MRKIVTLNVLMICLFGHVGMRALKKHLLQM